MQEGDDLLVSYGDKYFRNETKLKMREIYDSADKLLKDFTNSISEDEESESEEEVQKQIAGAVVEGSPTKSARQKAPPVLQIKDVPT